MMHLPFLPASKVVGWGDIVAESGNAANQENFQARIGRSIDVHEFVARDSDG